MNINNIPRRWDETFFGYLQEDTLSLIAGGILGSTWLALALAKDLGLGDSMRLWMPAVILVMIACGMSLLLARHLGFRATAHLLVIGLVGAVALGFWSSRQPQALYLGVPVLSLAYGLLGFRIAIPLGLAFLVIGMVGIELEILTPSQFAWPAWVMTTTLGLTGLAQRHLYSGLRWTWHSYQESLAIAEEARQHRAELARVSKALDEASRRLYRLNEAYAGAWRAAEEARRFKAEFAARVSHELRTPLNVIVGLTELMVQSPESYGRNPMPSAYRRDLTIVYRNARHLAQLVDDILDLARIENARMNLAFQKVNAADLVHEAVEIIRPLVQRRGLALRVEVQKELPDLWADPTRLREVLLNLLSNAARFTEQGTITITVKRTDNQIRFSVADTGIGIAPQHIPRIFEAFHQLDMPLRRRYDGAGLGLTLSKHFVELHGGRIWVDSRPGQGSTFHFCLPVMEQEVKEGPVLPSTLSFVPPAGSEKGERILVAITRSTSAARLLNRYVVGYRTVVTPDLAQARSWVQELCADGVVIDAGEKWTDSRNLSELARRLEATHLPVILCPLPGEQRAQEMLGVAGYLIKPVSRRSLLDLLRHFGKQVETILIIDDDRDFVVFMERLLKGPVRPYTVLGACSGGEGLAIMRHHKPDLVFLDLIMPDMDGTTVLQRMRAEQELRHIPVVIVSAKGDQEDSGPLEGVIRFTRAEGFQPAELARWIGAILDAATKKMGDAAPGSVGQIAGPAD